ncbi:hypothetical protein TSOC_002497 [Tetrabaena socialis]|uniref:Uncharacterized protein n=1 Tax=Tetrabaena socialis TaxID=47790 RepID=A0A2J8ADY1_9CHLO|nr:hypothetical protein TSOC_002497 [Tetrabaena socialis]|eukprot:PNH10723.1 hypothetical protein TSOC_002497 [Tetrabaena socialis]
MGKSKNGKYHKVTTRGPRKAAGPDEDESSEEEVEVPRGVVKQRANVGMLPPSDSDEEEEEEKKGGEGAAKEAEAPSSKPAAAPAAAKAPAKKAASDDDDDSGSSDSDDPTPEYLRAAPTARPKKEPVVEERTEEQIRKDLERLELIRKKREDDRLRRVVAEGWDRYAPVTDTNKPPGTVPTDHPSNTKA